MAEKPFSLHEEQRAKAISGLQTQHREPIKPQPKYIDEVPTTALPGETAIFDKELWRCSQYSNKIPDAIKWRKAKPKYPVGSKLWLREPWRVNSVGYYCREHKESHNINIEFMDDWRSVNVCGSNLTIEFAKRYYDKHENSTYSPRIHMPKWCARHWFEVTGVRAELLQDTSEEDAKAEGAHRIIGKTANTVYSRPIGEAPKGSYYDGFCELWDSIYGGTEFAWAKNPWDFVYTFRKVESV